MISKYPKRMGIHSRLRNVISKSGGYNRHMATMQLTKEYNLGTYSCSIAYEMASNVNIRDEIEAVGLEAVVNLTKESLRLRAIEFESMTRLIANNSNNMRR